MTGIFLKIAGMSMTSCVVIAVVLLLRLGAKRVSKGLTYFLWAAVFFRLLCPFTLTLPHAVVTPVTVESVETDVELYNSAPATNIADRRGTNIVLYTTETADIPAYKSMDKLIKTGTFIWLLGFFAVSFFGVSGFVKLKKRLKSAVQCGGYYICTDIDNPFILGIIKPKIYLPEGLTERERELILLHENAHIRRGDHIAKIIMYAALCIHWFNPLVWISFRLCERDMEIYCDSRVTEKMDGGTRADYSQALLNISTGKTAAFTACFGESSAKSRIKNILSYKKPALWIIIVCTILIGAVAAVLLVDRKDKLDSVFYNTYPCNGMTISCGGRETEYWLYEHGEYRGAPKAFLDHIYAADITQIGASRIKEGSTDVSFDFMGLYDYAIISGEDTAGRVCYEIHTYQVKTGYAAYFSIPEKDYNILLANAERLVNYTVEPPDYDNTIIMDTINGARDNVNITNHDKQYNAVEPQVTEQLFETLGQCNFVPIKLDIANMMASSLMEKINIDCTAEIISQGRSLSLFRAVNDDSRCVFGVFVLDGGNIYAYELTVPEYVKIDNEFYYISNYYYDLKHNKPVETEESSTYVEYTLVFPSGNDKITEYNTDILGIENFSVSFLLPDGWTIQAKSENNVSDIYRSIFSAYYIFNENNSCVGTVGYNVIPTDLSGDELTPNAIYNQIALGNDYCFDIREKYDVINTSDTGETAITDVYYSEVITEGNGEKFNTGILMYDSSCGVYVAFDLDSKALTYAQCTNIAKSIMIS